MPDQQISETERRLGRSEDFHSLPGSSQWDQDKGLGILDWDGTDDWLIRHGFGYALDHHRRFFTYHEIVELARVHPHMWYHDLPSTTRRYGNTPLGWLIEQVYRLQGANYNLRRFNGNFDGRVSLRRGLPDPSELEDLVGER